jgi:hypothetical protein
VKEETQKQLHHCLQKKDVDQDDNCPNWYATHSGFGFWTIENGKKKKLLDEGHGETKRRGDKSSSFILKKARILVQLQLQLTSLRTRVVSLEGWIFQIMVSVTIT